MERNLTPVEVAALLCGGLPAVATICGLNPKVGFQWKRAAARRPGGDIPSATHQRALLRHARAHSIPLTAEHLIFGAPAREIEELLAARASSPAHEQVAAE